MAESNRGEKATWGSGGSHRKAEPFQGNTNYPLFNMKNAVAIAILALLLLAAYFSK